MLVTSGYPPIEIPDLDIFSFIFNRRDRQFSDDKVIYQSSTTKRSLTFSGVRTLATAFGHCLQTNFDFQPGDVLALISPNTLDTPIINLGALSIGAIVSPANPTYTTSELTHQLRDCGAKAIVAHPTVLPNLVPAAAKLGIPKSRILLLGDDDERDPSALKTFRHWTSRLPKSNALPDDERLPISDPSTTVAFLVYSSGTTGLPKGVMLTHRNMVSNILQKHLCDRENLDWAARSSAPSSSTTTLNDKISRSPTAGTYNGERMLAVLPFFHIYALLTMVLQPLYNGDLTLIMTSRPFQLATFCSLIQSDDINFAYVVPPMLLGLVQNPALVTRHQLKTRLRMLTSAAAPLASATMKAVWEKCGLKVSQAYGLSETSPAVTVQRWADWNVKPGSVGRLISGCELRFERVQAEEEGSDGEGDRKEVGVGEVGEIYVKGPNVFLGYWKNEKATAAAKPGRDGWFRTGDVGYIDEDGDVYITDRVKELIKYKAFQVAPAELEGLLLQNELVQDVAVVGVESEDKGTEVPRAYAVRKGGMKAVQEGDGKQVEDWLAARVAGFKRLRGGVRWVEVVPKSTSGKILRRLLKDEVRREEREKGAKL